MAASNFTGLKSPTMCVCRKCKRKKPETEFYRNGKSLCALCKKCHNARSSSWKKKNPEKVAERQRGSELKYRYGLTQQQRDNLLANQNGLCPVCDTKILKTPCVDHDHVTGKIRGILCRRCNAVLGQIEDSHHIAQRATDYLRNNGIVKDRYVPLRAAEKKLLITGASGLVGSALTEISPAATIALSGRKNCDLLRWVDVDRVFSENRPSQVIHLAAKVGGVKANMDHPATFFLENTTINNHVLEAARIYGVKRMVCFLSTCVFPDQCQLPLRPSALHDGPPHNSNYGYAYAKRMLAVQCATYNQEYGTHFVPVIPANIYGRHDNFTLGDSHVVPALVRRFVEAKREGKNVTLWGSGSPLREFIHANDVARLTLAILHHYDSTDPIIISNGQEHSISHLAYTIANAVGFRGDIIWDPTKPEGQHRKPSDPSPLIDKVIKPFLPDFRFTSLETGIQDTVDWFEANYSTARGI